MIRLTEFCASHEVEISFILSLQEQGLVDTTLVNDTACIPEEALPGLERILRLQELNINPEGIDAITHLLFRLERMQQEITVLRNKLSFYETDQ